MARELTKKQKGFVRDYLETGNGSLAARNNYDVSSDETARSIASENLTKPNIRAYLESRAEKAAEVIYEIAIAGENDNVKLAASKDILDRAGYKPVDKHVNVNVEKRVDTPQLQELAQKLVELQKHELRGDTSST